MMSYEETVERLYEATPQFQRIGAAAYKPGLETARALAEIFGNPERQFRSVHVAGTNGKGSTCHTLAAVLQSAGYKVGLYTSPHLVDFRERMRINGEMIPREAVVDFMERYFNLNSDLQPSFFELTTIMAFEWFASEKVDIAIIETGLGGRLDTTNIIAPLLTVITNISLDHTAQLGNSLASIAAEKAGIIKPGIPVVIGNREGEGVAEVFAEKIAEAGVEAIYCDEFKAFTRAEHDSGNRCIRYHGTPFGDVEGELTGDYQPENAATAIAALMLLKEAGFKITDRAVKNGFSHVNELTGLAGRWMTVATSPLTICDTGHNKGGWERLSPRLKQIAEKLDGKEGRLVMVIGFVNDKDVDSILSMMPRNATYIFTQASIPRAMAADRLAQKAAAIGLEGTIADNVATAVATARAAAGREGTVFVGGSTFVVADLLASLETLL